MFALVGFDFCLLHEYVFDEPMKVTLCKRTKEEKKTVFGARILSDFILKNFVKKINLRSDKVAEIQKNSVLIFLIMG